MKPLSIIGLGLTLVFCCLLLALLLELYYMFIWKKRFNGFQKHPDKLSSESSSAMEFLYMFCWKKVSSLSCCTALNPRQICASVGTKQHLSSSNVEVKNEQVLCHTRYHLFTIMEETMEDLESDDDSGSDSKPLKSRTGSKSLNELMMLGVDETTTTPYLTPQSSPSFITYDYSSSPQHVFNPFLESSSDAEISKIKASPPPKFRFLQAADEKFHRRKMMEEDSDKNPTFTHDSFITIVIGDHNTDKSQ